MTTLHDQPENSRANEGSSEAANITKEQTLRLEQAGYQFAHDLSTPLAISKMNAELLLEYWPEFTKWLSSQSEIAAHLQKALQNAPELIHNNIATAQAELQQFKDALNNLDTQDGTPRTTENRSTPATENTQRNVGSLEQHTSKLAILLVDDEQIHHDIANSVIGELHHLHHAFSGPEAIALCRQQRFDVVLMDLQMPAMSGVEATGHVLEENEHPPLIVGLTSMPVERQKAELIEFGFYEFLDKPLKPEQLAALLRHRAQTKENKESTM